MAEHGIIFSGPMVRALLEDRKTQTRRVIRAVPDEADIITCSSLEDDGKGAMWCHFGSTDLPMDPGGYETIFSARCPYGVPGDGLWVRETWRQGRPAFNGPDFDGELCYRADKTEWPPCKWRPSIHMPDWATRIRLEITKVRVERVQDISGNDCMAEGMRQLSLFDPYYSTEQSIIDQAQGPCHWRNSAKGAFSKLWDSINAKRGHGWKANPWVWVLEFHKA